MPGGGGGAGGGGEAFPVGAAGLIDVDVGIDEAGQDGVGANVGDGVGGAGGIGFGNAKDAAGAGIDEDGGGCDAGGEDDAARDVGGGGHRERDSASGYRRDWMGLKRSLRGGAGTARMAGMTFRRGLRMGVLGALVAGGGMGCGAGYGVGHGGEKRARIVRMTTEQYWGWTICISAEQGAGGVWVAQARLSPGPGESGETGMLRAEEKTEDEARAAVHAMATRAVDERRVSHGKQ